MKLKNTLPELAEQLSFIYGRKIRIRGPYFCKDDRARIDTVDFDSTTGSRSCLLARALLEIKLGRALSEDETVDHIDENCTNDNLDNLQVLTLSENARKSANPNKLIQFTRSDAGRKLSSDRWSGDKNTLSKISNEMAKNIREEFVSTFNFKEILSKVPFNEKSLRSLLSGKTYKEADGPIVKFTKGCSGKVTIVA